MSTKHTPGLLVLGVIGGVVLFMFGIGLTLEIAGRVGDWLLAYWGFQP